MFRGEEQKKLDVLSNEVFVKALVTSGRTCILVSVEDEDAIFVEPSLRGKYCVVFDPLDGSSNIDCGVSIGTIFGIYALYDGEEPKLDDVLQPGKNMVAAGYCMYGSSCTFVLTTGSGVHGFTLDQSLGEFILTHPDIKIPSKGKIYSVNEGNAKNWDGPTAKYVEKCKFPTDSSPPKSLRYIGSMVADVHRTLLYGGVFLYPGDKKSPNGKLLYANPNDTINFSYKHVLYEVFPMSFLMEQAGGQAFTGKERALDLVPKKIHERSPIFLGSYDDIERDTVMDGDTGRSTGHEFVTSSSMQPLGRQELHGLQARMKFATDRTQSNFGSFYGFGLRSYGSGAGDKVLSTGKSSNNGSVAGVGSAMNSTVGGADKISAGQRNSFSSGATLNAAGAYEITYTRSGATTDTEAGIAPHTLRPLSPHLPIYKPQTNSTFSILDRISASYLTTLFVVYAVVFLKMGPICFTFEPFYKFLYYSVNLVPLSLELAALALAYHTYHGICHIWAIRGSRFLRFRK